MQRVVVSVLVAERQTTDGKLVELWLERPVVLREARGLLLVAAHLKEHVSVHLSPAAAARAGVAAGDTVWVRPAHGATLAAITVLTTAPESVVHGALTGHFVSAGQPTANLNIIDCAPVLQGFVRAETRVCCVAPPPSVSLADVHVLDDDSGCFGPALMGTAARYLLPSAPAEAHFTHVQSRLQACVPRLSLPRARGPGGHEPLMAVYLTLPQLAALSVSNDDCVRVQAPDRPPRLAQVVLLPEDRWTGDAYCLELSPLLWFHLVSHEAPTAPIALPLTLSALPGLTPPTAKRATFARVHHCATGSPRLQESDSLPDFFSAQRQLLTVGDVLRISHQHVRVSLLEATDGSTPESAWVSHASTLVLEGLVHSHVPTWCGSASLLQLTPVARQLETLLPSSVLMPGPRGAGKRHAVYELASHRGWQVLHINCHVFRAADSLSRTETYLTEAFARAESFEGRVILLLEHVHVLLPADSDTAQARICAHLRQLLAQAKGLKVVATSYLDLAELPTDLATTFLHVLPVHAPGKAERQDLLCRMLCDRPVATDVSLKVLAEETASLLPQDLARLVRQAFQQAVSRVVASGLSVADAAAAGVAVAQQDLQAALDLLRKDKRAGQLDTPQIPTVAWEDIGGLEEAKTEVLDTIQLPLQHPGWFSLGLKRNGILLYGPPGTGKTLLAKAVASQCRLNFFSVKGPELINMYVGESEANVRRVFSRARAARPCVIFFDELDSLAPNRGNGGDSGGVMDRVVSQLLAELDGLHESADVFVIGATNRPDLLDTALLRPGRFDRLVYLSVNTEQEGQRKVLEALMRKMRLDPAFDMQAVLDRCPPVLTGADLYALCADASLQAMRRLATLATQPRDPHLQLTVATADFVAALASLRPSVTPTDLEHYQQLRQRLEHKKS